MTPRWRMPIDPEDAAHAALVACRWPAGPRCPWCASSRVRARPARTFHCQACHTDFSVRTGTHIARSHVPLAVWVRAVDIAPGSPPGAVRRALGVSYGVAAVVRARLAAAAAGAGKATLRGLLGSPGISEGSGQN